MNAIPVIEQGISNKENVIANHDNVYTGKEVNQEYFFLDKNSYGKNDVHRGNRM